MPIPSTPSPLASILAAKTYNAAWFSGSTNEAKLTNAIAKAKADGALYVFTPSNFSGLNPALVTYDAAIQVYSEDDLAKAGIISAGAYSSTVLANAFFGATNEAKITAAIAFAVAHGMKYVLIPQSMLPYNANLVTGLPAFHTIGGKLTREGQSSAEWFDVKAYGAAGNDVTDDAKAIQNASDGCDLQAGGIVYFPNGTYIVGTGLLIGNRVRWMGTGEGGRDNIVPALNSSAIRAAPTFNGAYLVRNKLIDGTQEFCWIEKLQIDGNAGNGALCTDCVRLEFIFVNSGMRDCVITNFSGNGLHVTGVTTGVYTGPVEFDNVWVAGLATQTGHNILVDKDTWNCWFNNVTSENCAPSKSLLRIDGSLSSATSKGHRINNFHGEWNGALTNCIGLDLVNATDCEIDTALFFVSGASTGATLVKLTTTNRNISVRNLVLHTGIATTMINDLVAGTTFSALAPSGITHYQQGALIVADVNGVISFGAQTSVLRLQHNGADGRMALLAANNTIGVPRAAAYPCEVQTPAYSASITFSPDAAELVAITATNGTAFTINNPTGINVNGQTLILGIFNNSGGALGAVTFGATFKLAGAFVAPATGNWRFYHFKLTAGAWREVARSSADVPN